MKKIAFCGIRGIPANYSGFETFTEQISIRLAKREWDTTVYCRKHFYIKYLKFYKKVRLIYLPALKNKQLETPSHTFFTFLHFLFNDYRPRIVYFCGVGNAPLLFLYKIAGYKIIINVDGKDWARDKWGKFAKWYLKMSERISVLFSDMIIADATVIKKRYIKDYNARKITYIPYGARIKPKFKETNILEKFNLQSNKYFLFVSRLEPENRAHLLIESYKKIKTNIPLVIVGDAPYADKYKEKLKELSNDNIIFTGYLTGDDYLTISSNAYLFVLPSHIDGTRPVLLDQMGIGNATIVSDIEVNREVTGEYAFFFEKDNPDSLAKALKESLENQEKIKLYSQKGLERIEKIYNWDIIADSYEKLFLNL